MSKGSTVAAFKAPRQRTTTSAVRTSPRRAKPLVAEAAEVAQRFVLTDHAIQRCQERGIGVMEVYSALADPDSQYLGTSPYRPAHGEPNGDTQYIRGDIQVSVDSHSGAICTVIDLDDDVRRVPRLPINPLTSGVSMASTVKRGGRSANEAVLDEAWVLMPHDTEEFRKITVGPALAEKLLGLNTRNRPERKRDLLEWTRRYTTGEYQATHQAVAIDSNGVLLDGQNRLRPIVNLGIEVPMWIAVGFPPDYFTIIDAGRPRNLQDTFAVTGQGSGFVLGSIVRLTYRYAQSQLLGRAGRNPDSNTKLTNKVVIDAFNQDPDGYKNALTMAQRFQANKVGITRSAAGAGWYLIGQTSTPRPRIDDFFDHLIEGHGLDRGDPRLVLRKDLDGTERADAWVHLAKMIKCWNLWVEGRDDVKLIPWKKTESMPPILDTRGGGRRKSTPL